MITYGGMPVQPTHYRFAGIPQVSFSSFSKNGVFWDYLMDHPLNSSGFQFLRGQSSVFCHGLADKNGQA